MKTWITVLYISVLALTASALPWMPLENTDYEYKGPPDDGLMTIVGPDLTGRLTNLPFGGISGPSNSVIVVVISPSNGVCKIRPVSKNGTEQPLVFLALNAKIKKLIIDGGKGEKAQLPYCYVSGDVGSVQIKRMHTVTKLIVSNSANATPVKIALVSKAQSQVHTTVVTGPLKKLSNKSGGFGGTSQIDPGVIAVGAPSPNAKLSCGKKAALANLLVCASAIANDYSGAYEACWAQQKIVPAVVTMGSLGKVKARSIGPAVWAANVSKKLTQKQISSKISVQNVVGMEHLVEGL